MVGQRHSFDYIYLRDGKEISPVLYNIYFTLLTHEQWQGVIELDDCGIRKDKFQIIKAIEPPYAPGVTGPWQHVDNIMTAIWLQKMGIMASVEDVKHAALAVAVTNSQGGLEDGQILIHD